MMTATVISDCKYLYISAFKACLYENDLSVLGGEPEEREGAWLLIRSQYFEWFGGGGIFAFIAQMKELNQLASKIERIQVLVNTCKVIADEGLANELREEGYTLDPDAPIDAYLQQLDAIDAQLAPYRLRLRNLRKDLPNAQTPDEEAASLKAAEVGFEGLLIDVARFMKYEIDEDKTTMYKLYMMTNRMIDHYRKTAPKSDG